MAKANMSEADKNASAIIQQTLARFGLGSLGAWAWKEWKEGKAIDQIYLDMRERKEYKERFPAMAALSAKGNAISENDYVNLETTYKQIMHQAGLPDGFYDSPEDFTRLIAGQVAPTELKTRVDLASQAALTAPAETRAALKDLYGLSEGQLTAYWLDPDKALPIIQQQFVAAQSSGTAMRAGYGALTQEEAERVATYGLSQDQTDKGFSDLVRERELFGNLPGEGGGTVTRQQQLDAALGNSTDDQLLIEQKAAQRVGAFADKSRDFASTAKGIVGLGENPT